MYFFYRWGLKIFGLTIDCRKQQSRTQWLNSSHFNSFPNYIKAWILFYLGSWWSTRLFRQCHLRSSWFRRGYYWRCHQISQRKFSIKTEFIHYRPLMCCGKTKIGITFSAGSPHCIRGCGGRGGEPRWKSLWCGVNADRSYGHGGHFSVDAVQWGNILFLNWPYLRVQSIGDHRPRIRLW